MNPYDILGVPRNSSKEIVKKKYRKIALSCHPDKLTHIKDDIEKDMKVKTFKDASLAYNRIINEDIDSRIIDDFDFSPENWYDIWQSFFEYEHNGEFFKDIAYTFVDIIKPKSYYNPMKTEKHVHEISLQASFSEILNNTKRKLRLILVDIEDPIFVEVKCGQKFPKILEYNDENNKDHEIIIHLQYESFENYEYIENDDTTIDLITSVNIDIIDYIQGCVKSILFVTNDIIEVYIPPFTEKYVKLEGKGIKGGSFYVNISINNISEHQWDKLDNDDKSQMIRITRFLSKTI